MKSKLYSLLFIGLILLLFTSIISCSSLASIHELPEVEDGWIRIVIKDVGSIDYPTDFLELQSGEYRGMVEEFNQIVELSKSDFTLQQVGLNDLLPSAFDEYRRVMFQTLYLNPGEEVFRANERFTLSQAELAEFENQLKEQTLRDFEMLSAAMGQEHKLVESVSLEIKEVNGMFPFVYTYKRQLNDNTVVLVETYMFQNYDKIHHLSFSYRVVDEEECRDIYDKILDSFRLQ